MDKTRSTGLKATPASERGNLLYMGPKSEVFCRRALRILEANPQMVPPSLAADLAGAKADLAALDQLRPLLERLQKLTSLMDDSIDLLGSDAMHIALDAYAQHQTRMTQREISNTADTRSVKSMVGCR